FSSPHDLAWQRPLEYPDGGPGRASPSWSWRARPRNSLRHGVCHTGRSGLGRAGFDLGLQLVRLCQRFVWVGRRLLFALLATDKDRLVVEQDFHGRPHGAQAMVVHDRAELLLRHQALVLWTELGALGLDVGLVRSVAAVVVALGLGLVLRIM